MTDFVSLDMGQPIWNRVFTVAPLVVIGSKEPSGEFDLAPKHMAGPLGWENYFGFICTPSHGTYQNIRREREFTVSFPQPDQVVVASLAAAPRCEDNSKPLLTTLPTQPAQQVDGVLLQNGYLFLECELDRIVDGFGDNSFIAGQIVAAHVAADALRGDDRDDQQLLRDSPLLAFLPPTRYATIDRSNSFPFPTGMKKAAR